MTTYKRKFVIVKLGKDLEEGLFEIKSDELETIMIGDSYNDKIKYRINGFFKGLKYASVDYELIGKAEADMLTDIGFHEISIRYLHGKVKPIFLLGRDDKWEIRLKVDSLKKGDKSGAF